MLERTCLASQLLCAIRDHIERHGDNPIYVHDPDTDQLMRIGLVFAEANPQEGLPRRFELTTNYHGAPEGALD